MSSITNNKEEKQMRLRIKFYGNQLLGSLLKRQQKNMAKAVSLEWPV
jgi:hypothetical protein